MWRYGEKWHDEIGDIEGGCERDNGFEGDGEGSLQGTNIVPKRIYEQLN